MPLPAPHHSDGLNAPTSSHEPRLWAGLVGDGRSLISLTGLALVGSGLFAFFLSATGHFLPHDVAYLGMTPDELCSLEECRIVHFMIHDRVSFGGAIFGVGILYLWLAAFPLARGEAWAWWLLVVSGAIGFGSFLTYFGYGYLDTWHGLATLTLLPCFLLGMVKTRALLPHPISIAVLLHAGEPLDWHSLSGCGRILLLVTAASLFVGGSIIMTLGMTTVFVPQDLEFMQMTRQQIHDINARLIPLIAHDRAGFGGGVACCGLTMFFCIWCGRASRNLWEAVLITGLAGFGTAIGIHPAVGYNNFVHLAPACLGATMFAAGIALWRPNSANSTRK